MQLAFIGFGEAAQLMAGGFKDDGGLERLSAYDIRIDDPQAGPALRARAEVLGVRLAPTAAEAIEGAPIVLSMVQGTAAAKVAEAVAPLLREDQTFVDLNSISPDAKKRVAAAIATGRGKALEGSIMDAVKGKRQKVPILLAGPDAEEIAQALNAVGMDTEAIGDEVGQACAVKMIRSVMMKGVEALIGESMRAAEVAGVTERILDSVNQTFAPLDWRKLTSHYLRRTHEHGPRRVGEMKESAATIRSLGMEPFMSTAISEVIATNYALLKHMPYDPEAGYTTLLPVLAKSKEG